MGRDWRDLDSMILWVGEEREGEEGELTGEGRFWRDRAVSKREGRGGLFATRESDEREREREIESCSTRVCRGCGCCMCCDCCCCLRGDPSFSPRGGSKRDKEGELVRERGEEGEGMRVREVFVTGGKIDSAVWRRVREISGEFVSPKTAALECEEGEKPGERGAEGEVKEPSEGGEIGETREEEGEARGAAVAVAGRWRRKCSCKLRAESKEGTL